jgi:predicted phage tail protein
MLRKIKVYGALKKFLDWETGTFFADISNVAEVGRFLVANWPDIEQHMQDQHYKIFVGNYNIGEEELNHPIGDSEEIRIVPVAVGAKGLFKSSIGKILIGAAIIGVTVATGGFNGAMVFGSAGAGATGAALSWGAVSTGVGISLALGGVSQMLTPTPEIPTFDSALDPQSNYSFSGVQNVSRSGVPVNLIFGEIFTGSGIVSAGIDTVQVKGAA